MAAKKRLFRFRSPSSVSAGAAGEVAGCSRRDDQHNLRLGGEPRRGIFLLASEPLCGLVRVQPGHARGRAGPLLPADGAQVGPRLRDPRVLGAQQPGQAGKALHFHSHNGRSVLT